MITLANRITLARILGIPFFVLLLVYYKISLAEGIGDERLRWAALALFVLLALSDALDGHIARSRGEVTQLGRILDPIADKALAVAALILLTRPNLPELQPQFPVWFTLLVITREALMIVGALLLHLLAGQVHIEPRITGKAATAVFLACVVLSLVGIPAEIFVWAVRLSGLLVAVSGLQHLVDGIRQYENLPQHPS